MSNFLKLTSGVLHDATSHEGHTFISDLLHDRLGTVGIFLDEVILHSILDTIIIIPLLFLTYLFMEFIEHKASDRMRGLMERSGPFGTVFGAAFGALPQCGFSAAAANLYTGRVITLGTLIAVFLSTSDEMLLIMLGSDIPIGRVMLIVVYKVVVGIICGIAIDLILRLLHKQRRSIDIDQICENDGCHCERGIFSSALHHTLTVSLFIFAVTVALGAIIFFVGEQRLSEIMPNIPVLSHIIAAAVGLIPNCAVSVAMTKLALSGLISVGSMLSGLFSGAGVGFLVLFRMNKNRKENLIVMGIVFLLGALFGFIADFLPFISI